MSTTQPSFQPAPPPPGPAWGAAPAPLPLPLPVAPVPVPPGVPRPSALAVTAVVLSALALLGVVVVAVVALAVGAGGLAAEEDEYGGWGPLTGQLAPHDGAVTGTELAGAVRREVEDDGSTVSRMSCPDTARVAQNVTTVCHGVVDEADWAMVVFFEDASGNYTVLPA